MNISTELKAFAVENSWRNKMDASEGFDSWSNYGGADLGHVVVVPGVSRSRDSEILQESNFQSALDQLGGESDTVMVHRFGHWACGWFELITVDPTDTARLKIAMEITEALSDYPVLDETDFYEREYEYQSEYAEQVKDDLAKALCTHFGLPESFETNDEMLDLAYRLNMWCQEYAGNDSCINVYDVREPDQRDLDRLVSGLESLSYDLKGQNAAYDYFAAVFNLNEDN